MKETEDTVLRHGRFYIGVHSSSMFFILCVGSNSEAAFISVSYKADYLRPLPDL